MLPGRPTPIAVFLTSFDVGGTDHQMVELIRRLDPGQFEVHVACLHRRGPLEASAREHAASMAEFPIKGFARFPTIRQLMAFADWCRRIKCQVIQTSELDANVFGLAGAALARVPVRAGSWRGIVTPSKTRVASQRLAYRAAHLVVANSDAAAAELRREGIPSRKIQTIPNGVDCERFSMRPRALGPIRRVITVANLRLEKGHATLLTAARRVLRDQPDVEFLFVGNGPQRRELEEHVAANGLARHVRFLGERTDVAALLRAADLFVLPSRSDALPNSVLEAMATGLPVVATRVGGIPELIESGVNGVLIPPDHPDALAAVMLDLIRRPALALTLGRAARIHVQSRFAFDRMVAGFESLYREELARRTAQAVPYRELAAS